MRCLTFGNKFANLIIERRRNPEYLLNSRTSEAYINIPSSHYLYLKEVDVNAEFPAAGLRDALWLNCCDDFEES